MVRRSKYDKIVDQLLERNIEELKNIGKYPYNRTDGEAAITRALKILGIRYVPEYVIYGLEGDTKKYRIADFWLPKERIIIEHCGRWNRNEQEKKRYRHKRIVYQKNDLDCIFIYPGALNNIINVLHYKIQEIIDSHPEPPKKGGFFAWLFGR